jgi:excisionase family DNA binding protein
MYKFLSVKQVAALLAVSFNAVRRLIDRGELSAHKIGGNYRIAPNDVDEMLRKTKVTIKEDKRDEILQ